MKLFAVTVADRYIPVVKHIIIICADNTADCSAKIKRIMNNRVFVIESVEEVNESSNQFIEKERFVPRLNRPDLVSKIKEKRSNKDDKIRSYDDV